MKLNWYDKLSLVLGRFHQAATMPPELPEVPDYDMPHMPPLKGSAIAPYMKGRKTTCPQASQLELLLVILLFLPIGLIPVIIIGAFFVDRLNDIHQRFLKQGPTVRPLPFMEVAQALATSTYEF